VHAVGYTSNLYVCRRSSAAVWRHYNWLAGRRASCAHQLFAFFRVETMRTKHFQNPAGAAEQSRSDGERRRGGRRGRLRRRPRGDKDHCIADATDTVRRIVVADHLSTCPPRSSRPRLFHHR